jgi:hypothetical protein
MLVRGVVRECFTLPQPFLLHLTRVSGRKRMFKWVGVHRENDAFASGKQQRFWLAERQETLPLSCCQLEAFGDRLGTGTVLLFEYFGRGIGGNNTPPRILDKEFGILRNRNETQIAFACPT